MAVQYFLLWALMKNAQSHHQQAKLHFYKYPTITSKEGEQTQLKEIEVAFKPIFMDAVCSFHFCFVHSIHVPDAHTFAALSNADR